MTTDSWAGALSADWGVASDWSDDSIPNSITTDVTVAAAGSYTVDISSGETFTVDSLTLNASGATLNVAGALLLAGTTDTLFLDAGNLALGSGGTVAGGTIVANGGALLGQGGTLSGIAYQGTLDLSAQYTSLTLTGGTTFSGVGGTGAASVNFDGPAFQNSYLYVLGTETLDNATIDIGAGGYGENYLVNEDAGSGGAILTLGPNLLLEQVGGSGALISDDRAGDGIVNDGTILAESGTFTLDATGFTNDGSVIVTSGAVINVTGQVAAGLINSIVESDGGEVQIGGTVNGGTILAPDGAVGGDGGTLVGVSYQGTLDLSASYSNLTLTGDTTFSGAGGSGAATINFDGPAFQNSYLDVLGSQTLDNATIDIGAGGYSTNYLIDEDSGGNGILTLGPNLLLNQVGGSVQLLNGNGSGDGIINDGTILATGGTFTIDATNFTNDGSIGVSNGFIDLVGNATTTLINSIVESDGGVVQIGGTVNGGTILAPDGGVGGAGGTLDGVSYQGTLDLSASYTSLTLTGDTTFSGAGGSGAATINFDGPAFQNSYLYVLGSQTLDNATIDIGAGGYSTNYFIDEDSGGNGILTLGPNLLLNQVGGSVQLLSGNGGGDGIVNDGTILATGGTFTIDATNFTNNGSIGVSNGFIDLTGDPTAALINSINKSAGGVVQIGGVVNGGTILAPAGGVGGAGGTLAGVTYEGTLDLSASYTSLTIANGINLSGAGGSGAATINLDGPAFQNSYLYMLGSETLDNATLDLGSGGYAENYLVNQDGSGTGAVLTLGRNLTIDYVGGSAALTSTNDAGDGIVNDGTILGSAVNGQLDISPSSFTNAGFVTALDDDQVLIQSATFANSGSLTAASGGTIAIDATAFGNLSGTTLTGGSFEADANATLLLPADASIQTDAADITLSGSNSVIESSVGGSNVPIAATLDSIDPAGALNLLNGRNFTSALDFVDDGTLQLGASTFDTASLTVGAGGSAFGYGTIVPATVNDGTITAAGGLLDLNAAITGSGGLFIDPGATLELDGTVAQNITFNATDAEALILTDPSNFTGTLMNLTAGDSIDLAGVSVTSAVLSDGTIIAALTGGGTLAIAAPATNGLQVEIGSDGNGGSTLNLQTVSGQAVPEVVSGDAITLADAHVSYGAPEDQIAVAIANAATAPADGLDVAIGATAGAAYASGTISSLAAGNTDSSDIIVGLDNTNPGAVSGTVGLDFAGDGSVSEDTGALPGQTLDLSGNVYRYAAPSIAAPADLNLHVGDGGGTGTAALIVANTDPADGYSENLDASVVGTLDGVVGAGGTVTGIAPGASDDSSLNVTVSTGTAGFFSDTVEVAVTSDGTGIDTLGTTALGTYYVPVSVEVDNYATAAIEQTNVGDSYGTGVLSEGGNLYTLDLGTLAAGAADAILGLNLANTAIGPADTLNAVVSLAGDPAFADTLTNSGTVSVLAGQSLTFDTVDLPATNAGTFAETLTLNETDTNASGFSEILPTQTVVVTGTVVSGAGLAAPVINNGPTIVLPDVQTGDTDQTALSITNDTTGTATLVAGVSLLTGDAIGSGFISGLAPGATDDSSITVGLNTSQPGAQSGTVSLQLVSNGTFVSNGEGANLVINGGFEDGTTGWTSSNPSSSSGSFGIPAHSGSYYLSLGSVGSDAYTSQTLATQVGTEYAISLWYWASGSHPDDLNVYFGSDHILSLVDPAQAGWTEYTEDAVATSASTVLEIGAYNNPSWDGVDDVSVVATGTSATGSVLLPTQTVTVQGNVYSEAQPSISGPYGVDLHVGDDGGTYTGTLTVTNGAPANGYSEGLEAAVTGVSYGSATASGSTADIAAGQSDDTSLTVSQSTANAGAYYSVVDVAGTSDGTGIDQFGSTSLGTYDVGVYILVNNYATAAVEQAGNGALLAGANNTYTVDLGTFDLNSGTVYDNLDIANTASGQADYLTGNISAAAAAAFSDTGTGSFGDIGAGGADQFTVDMSTANTGVFTQDIVVSPTDANDSGYSQALAGETIVVTGTVSTPTDTAQPVINTPTVLALPDAHVGDAADPDNLQAVSISNIGSAGLYVVPGALTGQGAATGEIQDLAPGGTDDTDLAVGINDVIAHPTPAKARKGRFADSTNCIVSNTEARLSFAVATTERNAA